MALKSLNAKAAFSNSRIRRCQQAQCGMRPSEHLPSSEVSVLTRAKNAVLVHVSSCFGPSLETAKVTGPGPCQVQARNVF